METIADIVREMRGCHDAGKWLEQPDSWSDINCVEALKHYADRIEAAAKHTCEYAIPNFGCASENRYLEENARLRAALKPVLNCDMAKFGDSVLYADIAKAVREAQRIYNESEVK